MKSVKRLVTVHKDKSNLLTAKVGNSFCQKTDKCHVIEFDAFLLLSKECDYLCGSIVVIS
jgi:hypothetical protein